MTLPLCGILSFSKDFNLQIIDSVNIYRELDSILYIRNYVLNPGATKWIGHNPLNNITGLSNYLHNGGG